MEIQNNLTLGELLDCYNNNNKSTKIELPKIINFTEEFQQDLIDSVIGDPDLSYLTGIDLIDDLTDKRGAYLRELHVLSAPTGVGKTTMLLIIMLSMAKKYPKKKFLYIGYEQSQKEIFMKLLCYNNNYDYKNLRLGRMPKVINYIPDNISMIYGDAPGFNLNTVLNDAKKEGINFIFYDYIGAILDPTNNSEYKSLENEAGQLKRYAIDYDMYILAATQTSNNIEELEKEPKLYNQQYIANSKGIARKADVCFIVTRTLDKKELENKNNLRMDCYKNRNGKCPIITYFNLNYSKGQINYKRGK